MPDVTTTLPARSVPLPLRELGDEFRVDASDVGEHDVCGRCTRWCNLNEDPAQREATSVDEHGPWCSIDRGHASGLDLQGERFEVCTGLTQFYARGTYASGSHAGKGYHETVVRISLLGKGIEPDPRDAECKSVHFTPGEARHMAAILGYLADESEQTNVPNSSQQRCLEARPGSAVLLPTDIAWV